MLKLPSLPIDPKVKGIKPQQDEMGEPYTNLPVNAIVRLPNSWSGDSQGQETILAPSADKQTSNYNTRVLKSPSLPIEPKVKGIEP